MIILITNLMAVAYLMVVLASTASYFFPDWVFVYAERVCPVLAKCETVDLLLKCLQLHPEVRMRGG